jgi:hypothetical protein
MKLDYVGRLVLVEERLYQLQVIGLANRIDVDARERFIGSFQVKPGGTKPPVSSLDGGPSG